MPRSKLPQVLDRIYQIAAQHGVVLCNMFHAGDGNLHPTIAFDRRDADQVAAVHEASRQMMQACVDAGGTITGVARGLKKRRPGIKIIGVEPAASPLLGGGKPGPHRIQGIGANFIPEILQRDLLDAVVQVGDEQAGVMARRLMREEGIFCGISSGAAMCAAVEAAGDPASKGKTIVAVLPDTGERYLSTWLFEDLPPAGSSEV